MTNGEPRTSRNAAEAQRSPRPLVSVIVPTKDRPQLLRRALLSIDDQTYPNWEVVVVNDGGADVRNVVKTIKRAHRVTYLEHESNRGPAAARNTGLRRASGVYVAYLDDDDLLYPEHLSSLVDRLEQAGKKFAYSDACRAIVSRVGGRDRVTARDVYYSEEFDRDELLVHNLFPTLCVVHARACLQKGGMFDESLLVHEDWDLWIRFSRAFDLVHVHQLTCEYRWRQDGRTLTGLESQRFRESTRDIYERYRDEASASTRERQEQYLGEIDSRGADAATTPAAGATWQTGWIARVGRAFRLVRSLAACPYGRVVRDLAYEAPLLDTRTPGQVAERLDEWREELRALHRFRHALRSNAPVEYDRDLFDRFPALRARLSEQVSAWEVQPTVSVVIPIYTLDAVRLERSLRSLEAQLYLDFQAVFLLDRGDERRLGQLLRESRIDARKCTVVARTGLDAELAAAFAAALEQCRGDYTCFLSQGDEFAPDALLELVRHLNEAPESDVLYTDEENGWVHDSAFARTPKPEWSEELLVSAHYVGDVFLCRTALLSALGDLEGRYEADIRYGMVLRIAECTDRCARVARPLYRRWRGRRDAPAGFSQELRERYERDALAACMARNGIEAEVEFGIYEGTYRVRRALQGRPRVSIVVLTRDGLDTLQRCLDSMKERTSYKPYDVLIVDNGSRDPATRAFLKSCPYDILSADEAFNFARLNNRAVSRVKGDVLLFLNNDTEVITPGWLEAMLEHVQREEVGAVGAKLLYPCGDIQHAGIYVDADLGTKHAHVGLPMWHHGYAGLADVVADVPAVTGACMMVRKRLFEELGGFDESLVVICNDVDLCLRAREKGYRNIYTPYAQLFHHEGISSRVSQRRKDADWQRFAERWQSTDLFQRESRRGASVLAATLRRGERTK